MKDLKQLRFAPDLSIPVDKSKERRLRILAKWMRRRLVRSGKALDQSRAEIVRH